MTDGENGLVIRTATVQDAAAIRAIYNVEVENFMSTADIVPRSLDDQRQWLAARSGAFAAVVAEIDGEVVGFASLSPYRERAAYRTSVENSVYVDRDQGGKGIGKALMLHLIDLAEASGFHSMIARVEVSGHASLALHRSVGFTEVGVEREVGRKFGRWMSLAVLQRML